jgi:hypothetical protein
MGSATGRRRPARAAPTAGSGFKVRPDSPRAVLVGWSTAFVFAIVNRMYEHLRQVHDPA